MNYVNKAYTQRKRLEMMGKVCLDKMVGGWG